LKKGLIIASNTEDVVCERSSSELDSDDMLRVSSVASWHRSFSAWVSEKLNKTVIVTGSNQGLILTHVNSIDMGSISTFWENTIDAPSEFAMSSCPISTCGVGCSTLVLAAIAGVEEEKFISIAY
jgi:hypothetical protein